MIRRGNWSSGIRTTHWERGVAALLGFVWFLQIGGGPTLNPANIGWILSGDWPQHWLGWLFFRQEPWTFPLGTITTLPYPIGTSIGFTDSNPLISILLKPFATWLPAEMQFIGPWLALCFVMQGYVGAALTSVVTQDKGQQVLGGYLFALSPVLVARIGHDTLCAHWLLLGLLYLGLRRYADASEARRAAWLATGAVMLAASIHPYLTAMCFVLAQAAFVRFWRLRVMTLGRAIVASLATTAGMLGVFGLIGYLGTAAGLGSSGFGVFSSDLLTLVDPTRLSRVLPPLPVPPTQWEGLGFVGLGGLVAAGFAIAALRRGRPARAARWPVITACALMGVYACSANLTIAGQPVGDVSWLYQPVSRLTAPFRASGRFIWSLHYLVLLAGIWGATRFFGVTRPAAGTVLLAVVVTLQAADLRVDQTLLQTKVFRQAPLTEFELAKGRYRHLALVPMQVLGVCGTPYEQEHAYRFMLLAYRLGTTYNSGIFARLPSEQISKECVRLEQTVDTGTLDRDTIYVVPLSNVERFRNAGGVCGRFDGDWICVSRESDETFRTLVETGRAPGRPR